MHKELVDLSKESPLEKEQDAWYTKYHFISHAGGAIDGKNYTNSVQAWEYSYEQGNRVFDADLAFTTDEVLVLRHAWVDNLEQFSNTMKESDIRFDKNGMLQYTTKQPVMDYETFASTKIFYKYDSLSCKQMFEFMILHEDLYVACDMKDDTVKSYRYLVDLAKKMGCEEVLDRIIVSVYEYDVYYQIKNIYDFPCVIVRQHYVSPNNYYELLEFCLKNDICVVNVSSCYMEDEGIQLLKEYGIFVYVAVVDYISDMKKFVELGADGAVTNCLYESDWKYVK